ncbi:dihydropyrimidinase [Dongshaea marina]|uniref:dihydropyrimidinase n=1 Tax=Dongshaea marina TaxID=2047966 RepID=UPI000D3E6BF1|nr:dihydropyrimidinase [Dongshaea marina]
MATLIKNAQLVDSFMTLRGDLLVEDGKISAIGSQLHHPQAEIIDAGGHYLFPGGIDVHTHLNIDVGIARSCDDFFSGTRAAACGGTTSIIDHMGFGPTGCDLHHQLHVYQEYAQNNAVIDYGFHGVIQHVDDAILDEMASMVHEEGISSFKLYLTYGYKLNDSDALRAVSQLGKVGALTTVHPENDAAVQLCRQRLLDAGKRSCRYHGQSRPLECEAEAIARMINLARLAGDAPLYIVHLSNGLGLDYIRNAQRSGQVVIAETCPQYLFLDDSCYERPDASKFVLSPPLRPKEEQQKLWAGLQEHSIQVVATDQCSFRYQEQKQPAEADFTRCPNGLPGVENRMPLLFSQGVMSGRISAQRFVELTSYWPAQIFGLPHKGSLKVGQDADLVIFDPNLEQIITHSQMHDLCDYTPYEGINIRGWPVLTMSRGQVVARDGQFVGEKGAGRFIHRRPFKNPF